MFRLTGQDAGEWLQGQTTQDLRRIEDGLSVVGCLCRPTGQLEDIVRIRQEGESWLVLAERPDLFLKRVNDFVIMEDVTAERLSGMVISIQGPEVEAVGVWIESDRTGIGGFDAVVDAVPARAEVSPEGWNLATLAAGEPLLGIDCDDRTLPPELGEAFEKKAISYAKGCYAGQEVLMRIHSRGHTNKTLVGLRSKERLEASVHRSAFHPEIGWLASATLRNEVLANGIIEMEGQSVEVCRFAPGWGYQPRIGL